MVCRAFIPLDFGITECLLTMNIFQAAFCVLLAHSIFNFIKALATVSCNLIQKTCKKCFIFNKKCNEKMEMELSGMTLSTRILLIALPITSVILWVLVFHYSIFDDEKAAVLSYFACLSLIFVSKYVFFGTKSINSVYLKCLNYLAFFLMTAGCLLLSYLYMTAFYLMCLGILLFKMKYEVEQMPQNYFKGIEISVENITPPQNLAVEGLKEGSTAYSDSSKIQEQKTAIIGRLTNDLIKKSDQSKSTKNVADVFHLGRYAGENNHCSEKRRELEQFYDNLNKSTKHFSESTCSGKIADYCAFNLLKELYQGSVDQDVSISDQPTSASEYKKNETEETCAKNLQNIVENQNTKSLKGKSKFTPGNQCNTPINSPEYAFDRTCISSSGAETNEKSGDIFNIYQSVRATGELQPLDVQNKTLTHVDKDNQKEKDTLEAWSSDKLQENDAVYQNSKFQQKLTSTINDAVKSNTCENHKFHQMLEKSRGHDQNESSADTRQQLIDKVCEDIKSKIKDKYIQILTDPIGETGEFCRLLQQSSLFSSEASVPPCIIYKTDQMSSYPTDMINASLRKFNENKCFNRIGHPISNEQSNLKSPIEHTQMQSFGNDSSSTNALLVDPEVPKSTKIEDSEFYQNACEKRGERLGIQTENSDVVIKENNIAESASGMSADASVTQCSSATSKVAGTVNRIDLRFIYGVDHSFLYRNLDTSNVK